VDERHERPHHGARIPVLHHVAPVHDSARARLQDRVRTAQELVVVDAAAAAHEHGPPLRHRDDTRECGEVVRRIGLDDVRTELDRWRTSGTMRSTSPSTPSRSRRGFIAIGSTMSGMP
jgi:hypothetical protein